MDKDLYKENEELKAKIKAFEKYLPKRIVEKIHTNPYNVRVEGERRFVTILFGDVSGFTALSERLDPEEVIKVINKYFNKMLYIVEKYGGDVDKFVGDAIMVVFGAPVAHKNDPERAVRAALEMQQAIETIEPVFAKGEYIKVRMSIGINTGEIVALNMGTDERMEYTVMGDNVNLSARLEAVANATEVIISDRTYKYVKNIFDFEVLEPVMVKGKKDPIPIFKALSVKKKIDSDKEFPIISYENDLKKIDELVLGAMEKKSFSIAITGNEGTGKTKILSYIYDKIDKKNLYLIPFRGESFFKHSPFYPIKTSVSELLKIKSNDSIEIIKGKIDNFLNKEARIGLYYLFNIIPIDIQEKELINSIVFSLQELFRLKTSSDNIVLSFDDIHYFDNNSQKIIEKIYQLEKNNNSISFVFLSRDNIDYKTDYSIHTKDFDKETLKLLIESRLKNKIDNKLLEFIFNKTQGNPLYTIELIKFLKENNILIEKDNILSIKESDIAIVPDSLKSVFLEKIDSLDEEYKTFLQYSSIIGQIFDKSYLHSIFKYSIGEVDDYLSYLEENGYLNFLGGEKYRFPSEIFHNAIYNSLMKNKRKEYHNNIASFLEKMDYKSNNNYIRSIARHYDMAENEKASDFLAMTGNIDKKLFAYKEAIYNFERASKYYKKINLSNYSDMIFKIVNIYILTGQVKKGLEYLNQNEEYFENKKDLIKYYNFKGIAYERMGDMDNAEKSYEEALRIAKIDNDEEALSKINNQMGIMYTVKGDYAKALKFFNMALEINIKLNIQNEIAIQYTNIGRIHGYMRDTDNAIKYFEMAIDIYNKLKSNIGKLTTLINLGFIYDNNGNYEKAKEIYTEALEIAQKTGKKSEEGKILNNIATIEFATGNIEKALIYFKDIEKIYEETDDTKGLAEVKVNIAEIEMNLGKFKDARIIFEQANELCKKSNHEHLQLYSNIFYANSLLFLGHIEQSNNILEEVLEKSNKMNIPDFIAMSKNIIAKSRGLTGYVNEEENMLKEAYKLASEIGNPDIIYSILTTLVKTYIEKGDYEKALKYSEHIINFASESNNEILLSDIYATLADLYQRTENIEKLSEIVNKAFEISSRTNNLISQLRNQIIIARFYLLTEDFTSCESSLKYAEEFAMKTGSIEHSIIVYRLYNEMYMKNAKIELAIDAKLKCVISIEKYIEYAGKKYSKDLIYKRGFIKYIADYITSLFELYDIDYIKESLNSRSKNIIKFVIDYIDNEKLLPKNIIDKLK